MVEFVAGVFLVLVQGQDLAARQLLAAGEPLDERAIVTVLEATRTAMAHKAFTMYGGFAGGTVELDASGRPRFFQQGAQVTEWTHRRAVACDGATLAGDLVIEWEVRANAWQGHPRLSTGQEPLSPVFALWESPPGQIEDAGFREVDGVRARGLRYRYERPPTAKFEADRQVVWFDVGTLLPLRYELEIQSPEPMAYGYFLALVSGVALGPSSEIPRPACVRVRH